jgi:hypothetical protein
MVTAFLEEQIASIFVSPSSPADAAAGVAKENPTVTATAKDPVGSSEQNNMRLGEKEGTISSQAEESDRLIAGSDPPAPNLSAAFDSDRTADAEEVPPDRSDGHHTVVEISDCNADEDSPSIEVQRGGLDPQGLHASSLPVNADDETDTRDTASACPAQSSRSTKPSSFSIFRDLFFSAFADNNSYCCGEDHTTTAAADCCSRASVSINGSSKVAPILMPVPSHGSGASSYLVGGGADERGASIDRIRQLPDQPSISSMRKANPSPVPRKKPLAVAVGFKYAEDLEGRPIIVRSGIPGLKGPPGVGPSSAGSSLRPRLSNRPTGGPA